MWKLLAFAVALSCSSSSSAPPPQAPDPPRAVVTIGPFKSIPPSEWTSTPPSSKMRAAQFRVADDAELIIFYFGKGGAGSVDANLDRWLGQFTKPDGSPAKDTAKIEHPTIAGQPATLVFVSGHYVAEAMPGRDAIDKQDQALFAAIVASPEGPYFFELKGGKPAVDANAARFRAFLESLQLRQ